MAAQRAYLRNSKVADLVMDTVIYIASTTYSYILLSQFATQVAKNTITWSWATFDVFAFFVSTSIVTGFSSLAELHKFLGGERSRALSMFSLLLRVMIWITVIVELAATAAVATILKMRGVGWW